MTKNKLYTNAAKVQFLVEQELKSDFEKWCKENNMTMTDAFKIFMKKTIKERDRT